MCCSDQVSVIEGPCEGLEINEILELARWVLRVLRVSNRALVVATLIRLVAKEVKTTRRDGKVECPLQTPPARDYSLKMSVRSFMVSSGFLTECPIVRSSV